MEKRLIKFNSMMSNYEIVNPEFAKVKVYVCYEGKNRNRTEIPRNVLDEMAKTIYGVPVVAEYDKDNNCFKGHGGKLEMTEDSIEFVQTTVPYGFVDPTTPVFYETVTELDGITKHDYLCCYAYLWYKRYPEVESVLKNQDNKTIGQSMEVEVEDYSIGDDDYFVFKKAHFSALALLGVEPCFESAKATSKFSIEDSKAIYQEMMEAFKSYTLKNFEEGGIEVKDKEELNVIETVEVEEVKKEKEFAKKKCEEETEAVEEESKEDDDFAKRKKCEQEDDEEEKTDFEAKYNEVAYELNDLKVKYVDLETNYALLSNEVVELREFKSNIETKEYQAKVDEMLENYSELEAIDGYSEIIKDKYSTKIEELEAKIKIFAFDNGVVLKNRKNFNKKDTNIVFEKNEKSENLGVWSLIK